MMIRYVQDQDQRNGLPEYQMQVQGSESESFPLIQIQHHHPMFPEANHRHRSKPIHQEQKELF